MQSPFSSLLFLSYHPAFHQHFSDKYYEKIGSLSTSFIHEDMKSTNNNSIDSQENKIKDREYIQQHK